MHAIWSRFRVYECNCQNSQVSLASHKSPPFHQHQSELLHANRIHLRLCGEHYKFWTESNTISTDYNRIFLQLWNIHTPTDIPETLFLGYAKSNNPNSRRSSCKFVDFKIDISNSAPEEKSGNLMDKSTPSESLSLRSEETLFFLNVELKVIRLEQTTSWRVHSSWRKFEG